MAAEIKIRGLCLIVTTSEQQPKDQIQDNKESWICNTLATSNNNMQRTDNSKSFGRCSFDGRWKTNRAPGMQLFWQGIDFDVTVVVKLQLKRCQYSQGSQIKKHQQYQKGFLWCHQIKKVNDRDIIWYANLAHFSMIMLSELRRISGVNFCSFDWFRSSLLICSKVQPCSLLSDM